MVLLREIPEIEMICTGNELLDGTISDANSKTVAMALKPLGLKVSRILVVPDDRAAIAQAVSEAALRSRFVFVSGGLGPTSDDMTLEVSAHALGKKMIFSKDAKLNVVNRLNRIRRKMMNPSQFKQFYIPEGARVLANREGTAPGVKMTSGKADIYFLPGVPREFIFILQTHILPDLQKFADIEGEHLFVLKVFGKPESELNELMKKIAIPKSVLVGYRTHLPENHIKIQVTAKNRKAAEKIARPILLKIQKKLGPKIFSWSDHSFEEEILRRLLKSKKIVAIAESCTGGLATSMITKISGSSKALERSFITYSNQAKMDLLSVGEKTLARYGAVSKQTVMEMAEGALKNSEANVAVAITGVAGPTGGTSQKPVGTVWLGRATRKKVEAKRLNLSFDRELNQKYSAYAALKWLSE